MTAIKSYASSFSEGGRIGTHGDDAMGPPRVQIFDPGCAPTPMLFFGPGVVPLVHTPIIEGPGDARRSLQRICLSLCF